MFNCTLRRLADQFAPERTIRTGVVCDRCAPGLTPSAVLSVAIAAARSASTGAQRRTHDATSKVAHMAACQSKHEVLDRKKTEYWSERIQNEGSSPRRLWRSMSALLQCDKRTADVITPTNHDADTFLRCFDEKVRRPMDDQRLHSSRQPPSRCRCCRRAVQTRFRSLSCSHRPSHVPSTPFLLSC